MNRLFEKTRALWVRYSDYEWVEDDKGILYLTASSNAKPNITDPIADYMQIVGDAVNTGLFCMSSETGIDERKDAIRDFTMKYGLLGIITAIPTTVHFLESDFAYFPVNPFIKEEKMSSDDYLNLFFPFDQPKYLKQGKAISWDIESDKDMQGLAMTMNDRPIPVNMSLQRSYAERYDWLEKQFKDWAFIVFTAQEYYDDYDELDEKERLLFKQAIRAFEGVSPTYRLELLDRPTLVWEFNSLMQALQLMINLMLSDENNPVKICKKCGNAFIPKKTSDLYCSRNCMSK